ncbi:MAG: D-alanyl-D-alanine carboxypeptidase/D-alanyl-D-alanine-endopeptidase, partial [Candidatus Neomarinimicrobiota bacterium]
MIRKIYLLLVLILCACTQVPRIYLTSGSYSIKTKINRAILNSTLSTNMGIKVKSLETGNTLYEMNASSLFNPASNLKLFTAITALALIDTGFTYKTAVFRYQNNIYLVGGGDPDLSLKSLDSLAEIVSYDSIIFDSLILDATKFDSIPWGKGWMWDEGAGWYAAPISALSLNDNCVDFYIKPGPPGKPALINYNPETSYIEILNHSITVMDTIDFQAFELDRDWKNRTNLFTASGFILSADTPDTIFRNIENPTLFTGTVFKEMLESKGIIINNMALGKKPENGNLIGVHKSESLIISLKNLMKNSDNLTAEMLVKLIVQITSGQQGSTNTGLTVIKKFLEETVGIDTSELSIADGSGVSRYNYSSPDQIITLLTWAYR